MAHRRNKNQRNFTGRRQSHLMKSESHYIQATTAQLARATGDYQVYRGGR